MHSPDLLQQLVKDRQQERWASAAAHRLIRSAQAGQPHERLPSARRPGPRALRGPSPLAPKG